MFDGDNRTSSSTASCLLSGKIVLRGELTKSLSRKGSIAPAERSVAQWRVSARGCRVCSQIWRRSSFGRFGKRVKVSAILV
jgi:hypothetical protein